MMEYVIVMEMLSPIHPSEAILLHIYHLLFTALCVAHAIVVRESMPPPPLPLAAVLCETETIHVGVYETESTVPSGEQPTEVIRLGDSTR